MATPIQSDESRPGGLPASPPASQLILTVTRACNLRCSYCPTVKDGWPSLTTKDAVRALHLFANKYGGGQVKLFGGEPMLEPEVVRAVVEESELLPTVTRVQISTNGLGLDDSWLEFLGKQSKAVLTLSIDGVGEDHRRYRKALPGVGDAYDRILTLLPRLLRTPKVVVTQTIPPATAHRAALNFEHLLGLGFRRFNLLPGYYLNWSDQQLGALQQGFDGIAQMIEQRWEQDERLYLRNLFTWAPLPFFNSGLVVDSDRTIHPSNVGLSGMLDGLRGQTQLGTLDDPPSSEDLRQGAERTRNLLEQHVPTKVLASTRAVDAALSRFCKRLYPAWAAARARRVSAA